MSKIYFLREGFGPDRITGGFELPMDKLLLKLGDRTVRFIGNEPPTISTKREDFTRYRNPTHVLLKITVSELNSKFSKEGFYF